MVGIPTGGAARRGAGGLRALVLRSSVFPVWLISGQWLGPRIAIGEQHGRGPGRKVQRTGGDNSPDTQAALPLPPPPPTACRLRQACRAIHSFRAPQAREAESVYKPEGDTRDKSILLIFTWILVTERAGTASCWNQSFGEACHVVFQQVVTNPGRGLRTATARGSIGVIEWYLFSNFRNWQRPTSPS